MGTEISPEIVVEQSPVRLIFTEIQAPHYWGSCAIRNGDSFLSICPGKISDRVSVLLLRALDRGRKLSGSTYQAQ